MCGVGDGGRDNDAEKRRYRKWRITFMAVLTPKQRLELRNETMRDPRLGLLNGLLKGNLADAINGLDDYVNANAAAINQAIPQPARANLTTQQKALLLMFVVAKRYLTGA